jgi:hypothetical protein
MEEISDRELRVKTKREFDRFLPEGGIDMVREYTNTYRLRYLDFNDMPGEAVKATQNIEQIDPCKYIKHSAYFFREFTNSNPQMVKRRFRIFAFFESKMIGAFTFGELLTNPHGYGVGDFLFQKYIYPEFRNTKFVRFTTSDIIHFVFKSDVMNRLYTYITAKENFKETDQLWDLVDRDLNPGMSKLYSVDGPQTQTYISIPKIIDTERGKVALLDIDGEKFRKMDHRAYYAKATPRRIKEYSFDELSKQYSQNIDKIKQGLKKEKK